MKPCRAVMDNLLPVLTPVANTHLIPLNNYTSPQSGDSKKMQYNGQNRKTNKDTNQIKYKYISSSIKNPINSLTISIFYQHSTSQIHFVASALNTAV